MRNIDRRKRQMNRRKKQRNRRILIGLIIIAITVSIIACKHIDNVCANNVPSNAGSEPALAPEILGGEHQAYIYDVPLTKTLQQHTYDCCEWFGVNYEQALAIMSVESNYNQEIISDGRYYGLFQISMEHLPMLKDATGIEDLLNPYDNIYAGVFYLSMLREIGYPQDELLMVYNQGSKSAMDLWERGIRETDYTKKVMTEIKRLAEMKEAA